MKRSDVTMVFATVIKIIFYSFYVLSTTTDVVFSFSTPLYASSSFLRTSSLHGIDRNTLFVDHDDPIMNETNRRRALLNGGIGLCSTLFFDNKEARAAEVFPVLLSTRLSGTATPESNIAASSSSVELPLGLLECRVLENVLSPPQYGMESTDIFYPTWFAGTWNVVSKTDTVLAPCGVSFFGGNATYEKALKEVGTVLNYSSRFLPISPDGTDSYNNCIADRERNVISIAQAAMGSSSVVDIPLVTPNKLTALVAPLGSPSILRVDLITLNRRQETISDNEFHCSEVVREIVSPMSSNGQPQRPTTGSTIFKEIETTSLYKYDPVSDAVICRQRSASFLLPSQQSMMAMKMWEAAAGRPVDVRFYDVKYTRRVT